MRKTYHMFTNRGNIAVSKMVSGAKENLTGMLKHGGDDGVRFALMEGIKRISNTHPEVDASIVRESVAFEFIDMIPQGIQYSIWLLHSIQAQKEIRRVKHEYVLGIDFPGILG